MVSPVQDTDDVSIEGETFDEADHGPEVVGPQTIGEEALLQALYKDLARGEQAKAILAEAEMRRVIELNQQFEHRPIEGMGVLAARIPLDMFLAWTAREGPEFWHCLDNLDYFEKRAEGRGNPGFRVKTKFKPTIVVERTFGGRAEVTPNPAAPRGVNSAGAGPTSPVPVSAPTKSSRGSRGGRWAKR